MTLFLAVTSTRHTALGTFRPGIVYAVDPGPTENLRVIKSLTEGKDLQGKKIGKDIVGKVLTKDEADALMQKSHGKPQQIGAVAEDDPDSIDLDVLEDLQGQLRVAEGQVVQTMEAAKVAAQQSETKQAEMEATLQSEAARADAAEGKVSEAEKLAEQIAADSEAKLAEVEGQRVAAATRADTVEAELVSLRKALDEAQMQITASDQPAGDAPAKSSAKK